MVKDYNLTSCGLCCDLCDSNTTKLQDSAKYLSKMFEDPILQEVILMFNPEFKRENFPGFIETLELLKSYPPCPGCEGRTDCVINQCTKQKNITLCSECEFFDINARTCKEVPKPPKSPMMPPAPIFFQEISKRYRNWNIENLIAIKKGKKDKINSYIEKMIKEGNSSRDLIDLSVNFFESMK
ncbi:MAG: DUF3795 domain-containing protein [Promethearchaeota archaeon]